jgi:hypothetical protein
MGLGVNQISLHTTVEPRVETDGKQSVYLKRRNLRRHIQRLEVKHSGDLGSSDHAPIHSASVT